MGCTAIRLSEIATPPGLPDRRLSIYCLSLYDNICTDATRSAAPPESWSGDEIYTIEYCSQALRPSPVISSRFSVHESQPHTIIFFCFSDCKQVKGGTCEISLENTEDSSCCLPVLHSRRIFFQRMYSPASGIINVFFLFAVNYPDKRSFLFFDMLMYT